MRYETVGLWLGWVGSGETARAVACPLTLYLRVFSRVVPFLRAQGLCLAGAARIGSCVRHALERAGR